MESNHHQHNHHHQSSIEKYIDLDDIVVNPLDCYRSNINTSLHHNHQSSRSPNNGNTIQKNSYLDEFNFQFSVCSASTVPSSSISSSSTFISGDSTSNANNNTNDLNKNKSMNFHHQQQQSLMNECLSFASHFDDQSSNHFVNSGNNNSSLPNFKLSNSDLINPSSNCNNLNGNLSLIDASSNNNGGEGSIKHMVNNQLLLQQLNLDQFQNGSISIDMGYNGGSNCSDAIFGGFNFFNDEIKLEIQ